MKLEKILTKTDKLILFKNNISKFYVLVDQPARFQTWKSESRKIKTKFFIPTVRSQIQSEV